MRLLAVLLMGLGLALSMMSSAQADSATAHNFGRATCSQAVPCSGDYNHPISSSALISVANACITQNFGYPNSSGFFDDVSGIDINGCLTAIPNVLPKGMGAQLVPSCCIIPKPGTDACVMLCELNTQ